MRNAIKILIVDDDKNYALALAEVVKRMGLKPVVTTKPIDALNVVRLQTVHAAIVDVLLPKMTGAELVTEFRQTKFGDNPVVFVSGVFKDKNFASDTMRQTNAVNFLFKPFQNEELVNVLNQAMSHLLSAERWSVQTLLTRKLLSDRERAKAIENLEQIKGLDFPFVLGILMDVGSSGHLNIVNDTGEIFGVSLMNGTIAEVDSTESQATGVLALISKGYLSQEDWDDFQKNGKRKFSLERLVQEGFVSPHAVSDARKEQILHDFRSICASAKLQINFVPQDDTDEPPRHAVKLQDMLDLLRSSLDEFFPEDYLTAFYEPVLEAPIRLNGDLKDALTIFDRNGFKDLDPLKKAVESGESVAHALATVKDEKIRAYQCLHFLVLSRTVMLDDLNRAKNLSNILERYKKLYAELQGKTPDKIFEYFGATGNFSDAAINNIYEEYSRSNNPDQLGKDATQEMRDLCKKCFEIVTKAHAILADATAKKNLFAEIKAKAAENHRLAQALTNEGLEILRKGNAQGAFEKLQKAEELLPGARLSFISAWAEMKAGAHSNKTRLQELAKKIDAATPEEKKSQFYFMAMGLIKRYLGDPAAAAAMFEKALQTDEMFAEARRELVKLQGQSAQKKDESKNIFTGDITEIVSQLFRRKAD